MLSFIDKVVCCRQSPQESAAVFPLSGESEGGARSKVTFRCNSKNQFDLLSREFSCFMCIEIPCLLIEVGQCNVEITYEKNWCSNDLTGWLHTNRLVTK